MLSTMTSVASTMMPKSIAPNEIRLADCPTSIIIAKVNNNERGIVRATMKAARR